MKTTDKNKDCWLRSICKLAFPCEYHIKFTYWALNQRQHISGKDLLVHVWAFVIFEGKHQKYRGALIVVFDRCFSVTRKSIYIIGRWIKSQWNLVGDLVVQVWAPHFHFDQYFRRKVFKNITQRWFFLGFDRYANFFSMINNTILLIQRPSRSLIYLDRITQNSLKSLVFILKIWAKFPKNAMIVDMQTYFSVATYLNLLIRLWIII